jgi:hypothetical protein
MLSEVLKGPNQKLPGQASGKVSVGFNTHVHDRVFVVCERQRIEKHMYFAGCG